MDRAARRSPSVAYHNSRECGNVIGSYNTELNNFNILVPDDKRQVLEWLSPLASRVRHQTVRDSRVDGVGEWLLCDQSFSTWRTSKDGDAKPVLLCYGDPGVGKTYFSSLVIDTLSGGTGGDGAAVAYVYCDFSARNVQAASTVLASVLKQVVGALPQIPYEIRKAYEHAKKQADGCGLRLPEILEMLITSLSSLERVFICIDALDEFPTNHRAALWNSLQRIVRECPNTRLFLTGRPQIRKEVEDRFPLDADMLTINPPLSDIRRYIEKRLEEDLDMRVMDKELQADILRVIPKRISGIFLLVCINMDAILAAPTIHQRRQALHRMNKGLGLQDAYNATLDRIRQQGESKSKLGMEALMWISHSERPLKSEELGHALGVELGAENFNIDNVPSIRTVLDCTLGLITVDEEDSTVRLLHHTLQEYLGDHPTLFVTAHSMMAEICLTYLNCRSVRELPQTLGKDLATIPFLEYATCFWGTHAAKELSELVKSLALRLLDAYENHVSAAIFWRNKIRRWSDEVVQGISGLHHIAFWGITEIAIAMLEMKRWCVNARDSDGDTPLMWAVRYGSDGMVKLFLEQEYIKPDLFLKSGRTVFSFAAESGNQCAVTLLLGRGDVNPDSPDIYGRTPLIFAVWERHKGVVKLLLEHAGVNPNSSDNSGTTALWLATVRGAEDLAKLLLERGDINPNSRDRDGRTPLSLAASRGHGAIVKLLLECWGVYPNSSDNNGRTPLSLAVLGRHQGVVERLLEHEDVNPYLLDNDGRTPLSLAARDGREDLVGLLLEHGGANPNSMDNDGRTPLGLAVLKGHEGLVKRLLERGDVNLNSLDKKGQSPLSYAASGGHESLIKLLVESRDIDLSSPDSNGLTPLSYAAKWGREDLVELFLKRVGVNPNSSDSNGRTPLSFAASEGHECVVKLLLARGDVDPNLSDKHGRPPLSFAASGGHECVVKLLLECRDVDPNSPDNNGLPPLSYATIWGAVGVVKQLLERGDVNPNLFDNSGLNPLLYATVSGHESIARLLGSRISNFESLENCDQAPTSVTSGNASHQEVIHPLTEPEDIASPTVVNPTPDASISGSLSSATPVEQAPPLQRPPPDTSCAPPALSVPIPASGTV